MGKKQQVMRLWAECFPDDTPQWRHMFFDSAYADDEAITTVDPDTGEVVSSLLLMPYSFTLNDTSLGASYVYGAGTLRRQRSRGHMSQLMRRALRETLDRGDALCVLIPANDGLRRYYGRFGFTTVFYRRPQRYTSLHRFDHTDNYLDASNRPPAQLYDDFLRLTAGRNYCIRHTRSQFLTLMDDCRLCRMPFAAVSRSDDPDTVCAMAWGRTIDLSDEMYVVELAADTPDSSNAVLSLLHRQAPDRPVTIMAQPSDSTPAEPFAAGGMARVVNPEATLTAVARANSNLTATIRLTDPILPECSAIYRLHSGRVETLAYDAPIKADLDITPSVLTSILFSAAPIGAVMGLPSRRPHMSLMLD